MHQHYLTFNSCSTCMYICPIQHYTSHTILIQWNIAWSCSCLISCLNLFLLDLLMFLDIRDCTEISHTSTGITGDFIYSLIHLEHRMVCITWWCWIFLLYLNTAHRITHHFINTEHKTAYIPG